MKWDRRLLVCVLMLVNFTYSQDVEKVKGVSFVASDQPINEQDVAPIVQLNANWVTLMPYGFIGEDGIVNYNSNWQWWGEKEEGLRKTIELCGQAGLKIMVKPQIWMMNAYTGDFLLTTEDAWRKFERSYEQFILDFLNVSIELNVELFCIGTEWREFIKARPVFWKQLIQKARKTYTGKLIYAANWDDYKDVPFWQDLDFIGVNGYFPISINKKPTLKELIKGWEYQENDLAKFSRQKNRKIIFTEIGYRSMDGATLKPWGHHTNNKYSAESQSFAFKALFDVVWDKDWFAGMFIWKWYHNHARMGGHGDIDFTPQNKPAAETIQSFWKTAN